MLRAILILRVVASLLAAELPIVTNDALPQMIVTNDDLPQMTVTNDGLPQMTVTNDGSPLVEINVPNTIKDSEATEHTPKDSLLTRCDEVQALLNPKPPARNINAAKNVQLEQSEDSVGATAPRTIGKIVNSLNSRLVSEIGGTDDFFFSPFSISVALAMTYLGARGTTATEMEEVLAYTRYLGLHAPSVHLLFREKIYDLENTSGEYQLLVANGMFLQTGYELRKQYTEELKELYHSEAKSVDFANNGDSAVQEINQWSFNKSKGKIPKLLDKPLGPLTKLVLLNGIYFKGFWKYPFSSESTAMNYFYKADGTKKKTLFMAQKRRLSYYLDEKLGYQFLSMPYKGNHMSMWFILPNNKSSFPSIELTSRLISHVRQNLRRKAVLVRIPKFQLSCAQDLTSTMQDLGLLSLFSAAEANLSGMRSAGDLHASTMIHKALIDINEQGTEAAAVSGIAFESRSRLPDSHAFVANHPFLFCILDKRSGTVLFMGRLAEPE